VNDKIQAVRGMNDLLPDQIDIWHGMESILREVGWQYGYQEIRTPMLEKTALFKQSIGDQTDIVEKEMYTFTDSGEESLSLRPEATASTVRACIQHGLLHNQQQRFWYMGPMFRRERPQKGRYRQFHQFGVEAFGWDGPDIDAEIIRIGERIWKCLNVDGITLQINALGSESSRLAYRQALQEYLRNYSTQLDSDSVRRLEKNPLRILDSKVPETREIVANAPHVLEFLEPAERNHFDGLCESLEDSSIRYQVNSRLVRGLDYYTGTVFEWTTDQLGAQSAVCAGGRYDSLVEHRGGKHTPAIGFAMGMERLAELVSKQGNMISREKDSIYVVDVTDSGSAGSIAIAEALRNSGNRVINHCGGGKLKAQLKRADQSGAKYAIIVGQSEQERGVVQLKFLRENIDQQEISQEKLVAWFDNNL
jgi:histidyl-tRNA synthetase